MVISIHSHPCEEGFQETIRKAILLENHQRMKSWMCNGIPFGNIETMIVITS